MPRFLYRIRPTRLAMLTDGPTGREADIVDRHFAYLEALVAEGKALMAGRTLTAGESTFGIALLTVPGESEARALMAGDPAVAEGVMTAELFPFRAAPWPKTGPGAADGEH